MKSLKFPNYTWEVITERRKQQEPYDLQIEKLDKRRLEISSLTYAGWGAVAPIPKGHPEYKGLLNEKKIIQKEIRKLKYICREIRGVEHRECEDYFKRYRVWGRNLEVKNPEEFYNNFYQQLKEDGFNENEIEEILEKKEMELF